jgi:hypothetical protein
MFRGDAYPDIEPNPFSEGVIYHRRTYDGAGEDLIQNNAYLLYKDSYSVTLSCMIRDWRWLAVSSVDGSDVHCLRIFRLATSILLLIFTYGFQAWMLVDVERCLCAHTLHDVRTVYNTYQQHMYAGQVTTVDGDVRGIDGYFNASLFHTMSAEDQFSVCHISLGHMQMLVPVLVVWTLSVLWDLRKVCGVCYRVITCTRTVKDMAESLNFKNRYCTKDCEAVVVGLTFTAKYLILTVFTIPRVIMDILLLEVGARWLTAVTDFEDIVVDTLSLTFILQLPTLIWVLVPDRLQRETEGLLLLPPSEKEHPSFNAMLGLFDVLPLALVLVIMYVNFFQLVLVDFKWDVADVCGLYFAEFSSDSVFLFTWL